MSGTLRFGGSLELCAKRLVSGGLKGGLQDVEDLRPVECQQGIDGKHQPRKTLAVNEALRVGRVGTILVIFENPPVDRAVERAPEDVLPDPVAAVGAQL